LGGQQRLGYTGQTFHTPPKVDSQILILKRRPTVPFDDINLKDYLRIVKAGFAGKRKTLLNSLSGALSAVRPKQQIYLERQMLIPMFEPKTYRLTIGSESIKQFMFTDRLKP